jgi:hypothetical protein
MAPRFGPKSRYDGGIASWQGLIVSLIFLPLFVYLMAIFRPAALGWPDWSGKALALGLGAGFILLALVKYDRAPDAP